MCEEHFANASKLGLLQQFAVNKQASFKPLEHLLVKLGCFKTRENLLSSCVKRFVIIINLMSAAASPQ